MWYRPGIGGWWVRLLLLCLGFGPVAALAAEPSLQATGGTMGAGRFAANTWGMLTFVVENPDDQTRFFHGTASADDNPATQFVQELWLPPRSRLVRSMPFYVSHLERTSKSLAATALLAPPDQPNLALARQPLLLISEHTPQRLAVVANPDNPMPADLGQAMRKFMGLDERMIFMRPGALPATPLGYQMIDQLLLAWEGLELDAAQAAALRQWLVQGGRLWIMAEAFSPALLESLLAEQSSPLFIGQADLHNFILEEGPARFHLASERPIPLLRLMPPASWERLHTVQGWPAALRVQVGEGSLLVTTLGTRAWLDDQKQMRPVTASLAQWLFHRPAATTADLVDWDRFLLEQIGYRVIGRGVVLGVLAGFLLVFLLTGLWLHQRGRMEHMGWIGAILAVLGTAMLLMLGVLHRQDTPSTVVSGSRVRVNPEQRLALVKGQMQIYARRQDADARIAAACDGWLLPTQTHRQGQEVVGAGRMIWSDLDRYRWERLSLPENAVTSFRLDAAMALEEPVQAVLLLGPEAATIRVRGTGLASLQDVLLAGPSGRLAPKPIADGQWSAGAADVLAPTQYIAGVLAGQQQQLRQQIYRSLFELPPTESGTAPGRPGHRQGPVGLWRPSEPTLLGWSDFNWTAMDASLDARRVSWSLVSLPLEIQRPAAASKVFIPGALVRHEILRTDAAVAQTGARVRRAGESGWLTTVYDPIRGQWLAINQGGTVPLLFTLPQALLPLSVESAQLTLDIRAPGRILEIRRFAADQAATVYQRENPLGTLRIPLAAADLAKAQQPGGLTLLLHVSEPAADTTATGQPWKIHHLSLDVTAMTQEP